MRSSRSRIYLLAIFAFGLTTSLFAAARPIYKSLYQFQGLADGAGPTSTVVAHNGALFGTAVNGGTAACGCGTVFELVPPTTKGGSWTQTVLYTFQGPEGGAPWGPIVFDSKGNLYGTTYIGGGGTACSDSFGCGAVYRLSPPSTSGGNWTETTLYGFQGGTDGAFPESGVVIDGAGNLYGTTTQAGSSTCTDFDCGIVFELSPPATSGGAWTETVLHRFSGASDGGFPQSNLVLGLGGALFGAAVEAGPNNAGTVFQLAPGSGGTWNFSVIYDFGQATDGRSPTFLSFRQGALYGSTSGGTGAWTGGTVFKLSPVQSGQWTETVLFGFALDGFGTGFYPSGHFAFDTKGNLYGTTGSGGTGSCNFGCGTVFELSPTQSGTYTETLLHNFQDNDGHFPVGVVLNGTTLYGTTSQGGKPGGHGDGSVFEVIP